MIIKILQDKGMYQHYHFRELLPSKENIDDFQKILQDVKLKEEELSRNQECMDHIMKYEQEP